MDSIREWAVNEINEGMERVEAYEKKYDELISFRDKTIELSNETVERYGTLIRATYKCKTISEIQMYYTEKSRLEQSLFAINEEISRINFELTAQTIEMMNWLADQYATLR